MQKFFAVVLTLIILISVSVFKAYSLSHYEQYELLEPALVAIRDDLAYGEASAIPESGGLVINKLTPDRLPEVRLIAARLEMYGDNIEGLPKVATIREEDHCLIVVFSYKKQVHTLDYLADETIEKIRRVLEILRAASISIDVRSKKELVDCFGVDDDGKIHMINFSRLRVRATKKGTDRSIDNALSFIDHQTAKQLRH